jgi:hypothetical protein
LVGNEGRERDRHVVRKGGNGVRAVVDMVDKGRHSRFGEAKKL